MACRANRQGSVVQFSVGAMVVLCVWWLHCSAETNHFVIMGNHFGFTSFPSVVLIDTQHDVELARANITNDKDSANLVTLIPDESFHADNLDISRKVSCGAHKCFFAFKKNMQVGYLVTLKSFASDQDWFHEATLSYALAKELNETFGIHHFLLDSPIKVTITRKLAQVMNAKLSRKSADTTAVGASPPTYTIGATAILQKARVAPEPHLLIGNSPDKLAMFQRNLQSFLVHIQQDNNQIEFARTFVENMNVTRLVLTNKPCLLRDFQVIVDTNGQFHHFDLDRCFELGYQDMEWANSPANVQRWSQALDEIERQVLQTVVV